MTDTVLSLLPYAIGGGLGLMAVGILNLIARRRRDRQELEDRMRDAFWDGPDRTGRA